MNNTQKYTNLVDYSIKLSRSMQKFDTVFWSKPPKQMGSFNVTMRNVADIINNIKEIQKMLEEMRKLATLDSEAKKDNKSARKVADQISSIRAELSQSYARLKDEFFKQIDLAGKQCREVSRAIKDKEEKARFNEASRDFELMVYEARTEKFRIPLNEKDDLTQLKQNQARREHEDKEKQIDSITNFELQGTDKLESALSALTKILATTPTDDLSKEVRKEVAQIKKVLPPKTIVISKDSLERLRHSSHLLLDLEQISEIMKTTRRFMGSDGKLQKINKQLEELRSLLEQAIKEERERSMDIKKERDDIQNKVDYATEAVKTYGDILSNNDRIEREQQQIRDNSHIIYDENELYRKDIKKANQERNEILMKPTPKITDEESLKAYHLLERERKDEKAIESNNKYMSNKMYDQPKRVLPPEYTNMKNKLKNMSSLYKINNSELSKEGKSR